MFPRFYEFIIKEDSPLRMKQLAMAMGHEVSRWCSPPKMVCCKILEAVRKLEMALVRVISSDTIQART